MKKAVTLVAVSIFVEIYKKMQSKKSYILNLKNVLICNVFSKSNAYKEANVKI